MKHTFDGKVEDGKLVLYNRDSFLDHIKTHDGRAVTISIERGGKRSNPQNRYLWSCVYKIISEYTGYEIDEVHDICKSLFNEKVLDVTNRDTGEVESVRIGGSTAKLTTVEFMEYVEKIQRHFAEMGVVIPDPNEERLE